MVDWKPFEKKLGMTNCLNLVTHLNLNKLGFYLFIYFLFLKKIEFQLMKYAPNDDSLS